MEETNIYSVARYFISQSTPGTSQAITPLKLQKLAFYAQALSFAINGRELFEEDFEAWVHGPVSPELYYEYKKYRSQEINEREMQPELNPEDEKVLKIVWKLYGSKDGKYPENKTHKESPWREARGNLNFYQSSNQVITKNSINEYYSRKYRVQLV